MTDAEITVVVPTLGRRRAWLSQCLASIEQQRGVKAHVVLVAPSTAEVDVGADAVFVRYDGPGLSAAINFGWSVVPTTPYVTWLGDDDLLANDSLAATASVLSARSDCSMVYGRVRVIDSAGTSLWVTRPTRFAAPYLRIGKNFVSQPGSLLRRAAVETVGGLDTSLQNAMDQDLFIRLGRVGCRYYLRREVALYRWHDESITATKGSLDESELVRARYVPPRLRGAYRRWRYVGRHVDHLLDAAARRLPMPSEPPPVDPSGAK